MVTHHFLLTFVAPFEAAPQGGKFGNPTLLGLGIDLEVLYISSLTPPIPQI
jgi:hypothetical protein